MSSRHDDNVGLFVYGTRRDFFGYRPAAGTHVRREQAGCGVFVPVIEYGDFETKLNRLPGKGLAGVALAYLLFRLGQVLWGVKNYAAAELADATVGAGHAWGSTRALGHTLFRDYLFPFEAVSLVLLIAVVGALAVARDVSPKPSAPAPSQGAES